MSNDDYADHTWPAAPLKADTAAPDFSLRTTPDQTVGCTNGFAVVDGEV